MDPNQTPPLTAAPTPQLDAHKRRKLLVWGLICLIVPSAALIVAVLTAAIANLVFGNGTVPGSDPSAPVNPAQLVVNVLVFFVGITALLTWLPGVILGIILLVKRRG